MTKELGLQDCIIFHGKLNHGGVMNVLKKSNIFTFPTDSEGFPKAALEALACGLPVITNPVSVLPELIKNGSGILLKNSDPVSIANAIETIVDNQDQYKSMQKLAIESAKKYTLESWSATIGGYLKTAWKDLGYGVK